MCMCGDRHHKSANVHRTKRHQSRHTARQDVHVIILLPPKHPNTQTRPHTHTPTHPNTQTHTNTPTHRDELVVRLRCNCRVFLAVTSSLSTRDQVSWTSHIQRAVLMLLFVFFYIIGTTRHYPNNPLHSISASMSKGNRTMRDCKILCRIQDNVAFQAIDEWSHEYVR
jgi:hypothetical protein